MTSLILLNDKTNHMKIKGMTEVKMVEMSMSFNKDERAIIYLVLTGPPRIETTSLSLDRFLMPTSCNIEASFSSSPFQTICC